MIRRVS